VYRDFLSDEAGFRTPTSHAYPVQVVAEPSIPPPRPVPPYPAPPTPGRRTAILVAVAVLVGLLVIAVVAIWFWLAWHPDKRPATPILGGGAWQVNSNSAFPEDPSEVSNSVGQQAAVPSQARCANSSFDPAVSSSSKTGDCKSRCAVGRWEPATYEISAVTIDAASVRQTISVDRPHRGALIQG
jgi:hypothetical protein